MKLCLISEQIIKETNEEGFIKPLYNQFVSRWTELESFFETIKNPDTRLESYCLTYEGRKMKNYLLKLEQK